MARELLTVQIGDADATGIRGYPSCLFFPSIASGLVADHRPFLVQSQRPNAKFKFDVKIESRRER